MSYWKRWERFNPLARVGMIAGGVVLAAGLAFVFGLIVMLLWNWLMPAIFGLPAISYWQGWGLVLLAHILFKAGHGGPGRENWKRRARRRAEEEARPGEGGGATPGPGPQEA